MTPVTVLTVDVGTTRLKTALFNAAGEQVAIRSCNMTVLRPFEGASEMNMHAVWLSFAELCRELAATNPRAWQTLSGVAITGQGDGMWPMEADGNPVGNAILWNDSRAKQLRLTNEDEIVAFCQTHAMSPLFVGASPTILRWMFEFEPERFQKIRHVVHCKDWLVYKLTGRIMTDRSDASTALMNVLQDHYEFDLLPLMGLPETTAQVFPEILESMTIVGKTTTFAEITCSLPTGLPVMAGALDAVAANYGAGARDPGDTVTILGTTISNTVLLHPEQVSHKDVAGSTLCYMGKEMFMRMMGTTNGCSAIDWVKELMLSGKRFEQIEAGVSEVMAGAEGLFFHPYLNGERAPFRNSHATAMFSGMVPRHTAFHLMRAVYEGLAYSIRDCYERLPQGETPVILTGGASASSTLCQICTDVLNRPMLRVVDQEFGLYGMAVALFKVLGCTIPDKAARKHGELFTPQPEITRLYDEGYQIYRQLRENSTEFWRARARFIELSH